MGLKKAATLIIVFSLICLLVSCENDNLASGNVSSNSTNNSTGRNERPKLVLYTVNGTEDELGMAQGIFSQKNTGAAVEYKTFYLDEEYKKMLTTEIMTNNGPDMIYSICEMPSVYKFMSSGAFADLNEFISKDKSFKLEDYFEKIMDAGVIEGKRYFIPAGFQLPICISSAGRPEKNGIRADISNWTWNDIMDSAQKNGWGKEQNKRYYYHNPYPYVLLYDESLRFIDYKNRQANFDSPEYIQVLETYKRLNDYICPGTTVYKYKNAFFDMFAENSLLFSDYKLFSSCDDIFAANCILKSVYKGSLEICTIPTFSKNERIQADISGFIAISNSSKYKEHAYEFVKSVLSEENQSGRYFIGQFPVNKKAFENYNKKYISQDVVGKQDAMMYSTTSGNTFIDYQFKPLDKRIVDKLDSIISNIGEVILEDNTVFGFIEKMLPALMDGTKTAEQTAKELNSNVNLYLNE